MKSLRPLATSATVVSFSVLATLAACSGAKKDSGFNTGSGDGGLGGESGGFGNGEGGGPCVNLQCQQQSCGGGGTTTVSGQILDPAGQTPLYNVIVYVPNVPTSTPDDGYATCDQCGTVASSPVVSTLSDTSGNFQLQNVPVGDNIPLVVQVGKWQRLYTIPHVNACTDNPIDHDLTRLPKNSSEGHIPKIAVATGDYDSLECFIKKIGVDESEFSNGGGSGRVQLYQGVGGSAMAGTPVSAVPFWSDVNQLKAFDIVALTCEGSEYGKNPPGPDEKPPIALDAMRDYTNGGGRVFATHYHYYWFEYEPATQDVATWSGGSASGDYLVDTSFPKGSDFADWMQNVHATTTRGHVPLNDEDVADDVGVVNSAQATRWIYQGTGADYSTKYMTFNTPVGAAAADQCGRVVFSDIHVESEDAPEATSGTAIFPSLCTGGTMTAQEQALEFLFFDLNSCVQDDSTKPAPPR